MTIIEAALTVLEGRHEAMSAQEIYNQIQNKAIEQFRYVSIMKLIDSGFTIKYIDKDGYENDLEVV